MIVAGARSAHQVTHQWIVASSYPPHYELKTTSWLQKLFITFIYLLIEIINVLKFVYKADANVLTGSINVASF